MLSASKEPGASLKKGTVINLVVSTGPKPIVITNYEGTPYDAAAAALTGAGFRVVERSAYSNKIAKDLVLRQDPQSGRGANGETVTLTRSLGSLQLTVPNVQRMALPAARKVMRRPASRPRCSVLASTAPGVDFVI